VKEHSGISDAPFALDPNTPGPSEYHQALIFFENQDNVLAMRTVIETTQQSFDPRFQRPRHM
jgi:hypothetical protein